MTTERRRSRRISIQRSVLIELSDGSNIVATATNLSVQGIGITYAAPAEVGSLFTLHFKLPFRRDLHKLSLPAEVRHSHLCGDRYYIGFEFREVDELSHTVLDAFIKEVENKRVFAAG